MKIYLIPGLGADKRLFNNLSINRGDVHYIEWLVPHDNEDMSAYAKRLSIDIKPYEENILIGVSAGAILSLEIAKLLPVKHVIVISSIKTDDEMPEWMKWVGRSKLNRFFSFKFYAHLKPFYKMFLGHTKQDSELFYDMYKSSSPIRNKWLVDNIINWKNAENKVSVTHIHGDKDILFPISKIKNPITINGGTHVMVYEKGADVSIEVNKVLENI